MTQVIIDFPGIRDAILRDHYANLPRAEGSASPSMDTLLGAYFSAFEGPIELKVALSLKNAPADGARQAKRMAYEKAANPYMTDEDILQKFDGVTIKKAGVDLHNWTPDSYGTMGDA